MKRADHCREFRDFADPDGLRRLYQPRALKDPRGLIDGSNPEFDQEFLILETQEVSVDLVQVVFLIGSESLYTKEVLRRAAEWPAAAAV